MTGRAHSQAQMTGQLLMKQQQYEAAKLKMEQLTRQDRSRINKNEVTNGELP